MFNHRPMIQVSAPATKTAAMSVAKNQLLPAQWEESAFLLEESKREYILAFSALQDEVVAKTIGPCNEAIREREAQIAALRQSTGSAIRDEMNRRAADRLEVEIRDLAEKNREVLAYGRGLHFHDGELRIRLRKKEWALIVARGEIIRQESQEQYRVRGQQNPSHLGERRIVRLDGRHFLCTIIFPVLGGSAPSYRLGSLEIEWVTDSLAQFDDCELQTALAKE